MTNTPTLFSFIGRFLKSAAAPMPSPELEALRAATTQVTEAADHLVKAADDIGEIVRKYRRQSRKKAPTKKAATE